ncbi:MAG: glycoside hydrolase/phage tail family protein [Hyphomicrobiales bacterium]
MATLVLQYAGAAVGGAIGGPIGSTIGRAVGAIAGSFIDQALFAPKPRRREGPRLDDLRIMGSTEGAPIPRIFGAMRLAGEVIWATDFDEVVSTSTEKAGGKGASSQPKTKTTEYLYYANFAVALCEGPIAGIGRIWADGKPFDPGRTIWRWYPGDETQELDSLIVAKEGADTAPAYRGTAYVVFERLALARFGNRLPQLSFEVFRHVTGAADLVRAVNIIPGATEFGYDTRAVTRKVDEGETAPENTHMLARVTDWSVSLDDLQRTCPNLGSAALTVSWFGDDLRCGECSIAPRVESDEKKTPGATWRVAGLEREDAHQVEWHDGRPAYGGTPSDPSVVHAIADLKARGLKVTFYPFILMDIAAGNDKIDPYTEETAQPAFPWRGRITCMPAPGRPGSPEKTMAVNAEIESFIGTAAPGDFAISGSSIVYSGPAEWSLRRMVLHYAKLCAMAGGVDAFLIGSELPGLTSLRDGPGSYPFVAALSGLADDVATILPDAKISYAADWSEYSGHRPLDGSGDHYFHLDPLWSSPSIHFVGIDNYLPVADWRDGTAHADYVAGARSIYDPDYLKANIAGGEYFDWYYASFAYRQSQTRTAITDGAYGKPWVYRAKDIVSWWSEPHHDRPGGVESATPTGWLPQSKPIRFTELGCPAVDKGANQPNVFYDPKSSESALPYFSSGRRDDVMLHRFLEAVLGYWSEIGAHNPMSPVYDGPMVDGADIHLWAWDARPYPAFPALDEVWADGANHARGHWLNGRIGSVTLDRLVAAICEDYGFVQHVEERIDAVIAGYALDRIMAARDALEPLSQAFAFDAVEAGDVVKFRPCDQRDITTIAAGDLVRLGADKPDVTITRQDEALLPQSLTLSYTDTDLDYRRGAVESQDLTGASRRETGLDLPCAMNQQLAGERAEMMLREAWASRETYSFALPLSRLALEPGDVVALDLAARRHVVRITEVSDGGRRDMRAVSHDTAVYEPAGKPARNTRMSMPAVAGPPLFVMMDLPLAGEGVVAHAPWIAAAAKPWPGALNLLERLGSSSFALNRVIEAPASIGTLVSALPLGQAYRFDRSSRVTVKLHSGALSSVGETELLAGANAAAIGSMENGWEIVQFRDAELIGAGLYEISRFLRGQRGTEKLAALGCEAGGRFVLLDAAVVQADTSLAAIGSTPVWRIGPAGSDHGDPAYVEFAHELTGLGLRPLAPCGVRARRDAGDMVISWIRRTRIDGDSWGIIEVPLGEESESYRLEILLGSSVLRSVTLAEPLYRYAAADELADFGAPQSSLAIRVAQVSAILGPGTYLESIIHV